MKVFLKFVPIPRPKKRELSTNHKESFPSLNQREVEPRIQGRFSRRTENWTFFLSHPRIVFWSKLPGNTKFIPFFST